MDLEHWVARPRPARDCLEGRYVRLAPLGLEHGESLFEAGAAAGVEDRFRWLFDQPLTDRARFETWLSAAITSEDPMFFAVIDKASGRAEGRQALMRIDPANGVVEIGNILWGPALQQSRMATEALFLFAEAVFALGYRRFEWKCNDLNLPSKRAALRFGFRPEGVFRQHMVIKGANRDTAWFAMTDQDWAANRARYIAWLQPQNFTPEGQQLRRLAEC